MKKFMLMAAAVLMTLSAGAQNADALKAVKGAKKYSEANEIMKTQAESMTNQEQAQAYNAMVKLALSEYQKAEAKAVEAQVKQDADEEANQRTKSVKAAYNAVKAAMSCDKADRQPNDKGQVKPKFRKANQTAVISARNAMINAGLDTYNNKDYASAQKYFGIFVDSRVGEFYEGFDFSAEQSFAQIAYYAALAAYFNQDYKKTVKYTKVALDMLDSSVTADEVIMLQLGAGEGLVKNAEVDSVKFVKDVAKLYKQYPDNEMVFGKLVALYQETNDMDSANKLLNERIAKNPNDAMALAYVGQNAQNEGKWDEAIDAYQKALVGKPDFIPAKSNLAVCFLNRGVALYEAKADASGRMDAAVKEKVLGDLNQSKTILEEVSKLDPNQEQARWEYQLNRVNYALDQLK